MGLIKLTVSIWIVLNTAAAGVPGTVSPTSAAAPKSFAVFGAAYNTEGGPVVGGVSGTAFFISPTLAITAYHVLQPKSFKTGENYKYIRLWLVRENSRPIELKPEYLTYQPENDLTLIRLPEAEKVAASLVYGVMPPVAPAPAGDLEVETSGFVANSAGPVLVRKDGHVEVVHVPRLERRNLRGKLLRETRITLQATDVNLKDTRCVQVSYEPIVGISGGPVVMGGQVIGMNSFADPATRRQTWALRLTRLGGV